MAANTVKCTRRGIVKGRPKTYNPRLSSWVKRESISGRSLAMQKGREPFRGVKVERSARVIAFPKAMGGTPALVVEGDLLPAA